MNYFNKKIDILNYSITTLLIVVAFLLIMVWFNITPSSEISLRVAPPGSDILKQLSVQKINIKGIFERFKENPPTIFKDSWSRFRGDNYDNIKILNIPLKGVLEQSSLNVKWSVKLGEGYAGAAIRGGLVYLLDYDKKNESDTLKCMSLEDGNLIWQRSYKIPIKRNHGISRTVPSVNDKYVVTIGPKCQVMCLDAKNGNYKWGIDLPSEYNTKIPLWYTAQCPLIDGNIAVIAPSGKVLLMGVDLETGKVLFETPNDWDWDMSHSSIMPMTLHGIKTYVYAAIGGLVGISAEEEDKGKILFKTTDWNHSVVSPSPVQVKGDRIFVTGGYGVGSMMFRVFKEKESLSIKPEYQLEKTVFACEQHTPIFYKDHLYSILPNDSGELNRQLVCMSVDGKIKWTSGRENRFGLGPFIIADDKIFILDDNGVLTVVKASITEFSRLSRVKVLSGRESWAPLAISDGMMLLRDFEELVCLDLNFIESE